MRPRLGRPTRATGLPLLTAEIPAGASEVLGSYIKQKMKFFVAKVNLAEHDKLGGGTLRPIQVAYERRNRDLDPQLVWRGKDEQDWSDLVVHAPPLYIQEKVHPKALIDDLLRQSREARHDAGDGPGRAQHLPVPPWRHEPHVEARG